MKARQSLSVLTLVVAIASGGFHSTPAQALSTAFTYQGQLNQAGRPATGPCDLQFSLYDAVSAGSLIGTTQTSCGVTVTNGLFATTLDFGAGAFSGSDRWLSIGVRCPSASPCPGGSFTPLTPRQQLTAAPYSLYALNAGSASGLSCTGCVNSSALGAGAVTAGSIASGTIQQSNLAFTPVLSVGASAPLVSSGGQSPNISLTGTVPVANGGTGTSTAAGARTNLGAAASGANADITSLTGITGNIVLPDSTSPTAGNLYKGGSPFLHNFGPANTFLGLGAGNFSVTGGYNTAAGALALLNNTTGNYNTGMGALALQNNTTGSNNTATGYQALVSNVAGNSDTATGYQALGSNIAGNSDTAMGYQALRNNTAGVENTALGAGALLNSTSDFNTAVGSLALTSNIDGVQNVAVGDKANRTSQHASGNVAVGSQALRDATVGANTAVGAFALQYDTTGDSNTAIGWSALIGTSGNNNTAVGRDALRNVATGNGNIGVGRDAGINLNTASSNNIAIGNVGVAGESSTTRIGTGQTKVFIAGASGAGISGGVPVVVNAAGQLGTVTGGSTRFTDNGDGTVTDHQTGLMWEKKTGSVGANIDCTLTGCDAQNVNSVYQWCQNLNHGPNCDNYGPYSNHPPDGGAFFDFLTQTNGQLCLGSCNGLGGHTDWRLPTIAELRTIVVHPCGTSPCIDPVFGPTATNYWSSTTSLLEGYVQEALTVNFSDGSSHEGDKTGFAYVRAVRGGK